MSANGIHHTYTNGINTPLLPDESQSLIQHEQVIERGLKSFIEVGNALLAIRDERLYREHHATFEDYCQERWGITPQHGGRLIASAIITKNLEPVGSIPPANERQTRPLTSLEPDEQRIVWEVVQKTAPNGNVTASHVKSVADVFKTVIKTGAIDNGEGEDIPIRQATIDHVKAIVTEETYERTKRQETYISEKANGKPHVTHNSGENEWYTPPHYIQLARDVMGCINTDPASSDIANKTVQADTYYTIETNGLNQSWYGNVWMNPPYSSELIRPFIDKLISEFRVGHILQAIVLTNGATDTQWFHALMDIASAVCFPKGRINYLKPDGQTVNSPLQGQAFTYIGSDCESFIREFKSLGVALYVIP